MAAFRNRSGAGRSRGANGRSPAQKPPNEGSEVFQGARLHPWGIPAQHPKAPLNLRGLSDLGLLSKKKWSWVSGQWATARPSAITGLWVWEALRTSWAFLEPPWGWLPTQFRMLIVHWESPWNVLESDWFLKSCPYLNVLRGSDQPGYTESFRRQERKEIS